MNTHSRRPVAGQLSLAFNSVVGIPIPSSEFPGKDYLIDPGRFPSEGNWAFCRFTSQQVPATRIGFQRGGFNGGSAERDPSRSYLQLHLELLTDEGAVLWIPSGKYDASKVICDPERMDMRFDHEGRRIFHLSGWPSMQCRFCSEDGYAAVDLQLNLKATTVLPDCMLPNCLFAMWESMGEVRGSVRYGSRAVSVEGKVFFDHTRVLPLRHAVIPRHMYVYTTLYFEDGSGVFGYHSLDATGRPIDEYCFAVYMHADGGGRLLSGHMVDGLGSRCGRHCKKLVSFLAGRSFVVVCAGHGVRHFDPRMLGAGQSAAKSH